MNSMRRQRPWPLRWWQAASRRGSRGHSICPILPQFMIIYFGILRAGGVVTATNPLYAERELEHQIRDCGAETVFVMSRYLSEVEKCPA